MKRRKRERISRIISILTGSNYFLQFLFNASRLNYRALQKSHIAFKEFRSDSRFRIALRNEELKTPWRASPAPCILFLARGKVISKRSLSIRKLDCVNGHGISSFLKILPALEMRKKMKWKRKEDLFSLSLSSRLSEGISKSCRFPTIKQPVPVIQGGKTPLFGEKFVPADSSRHPEEYFREERRIHASRRLSQGGGDGRAVLKDN